MRNRTTKLLGALALSILLLCLLASSAVAVPELGLQLQRIDQPLHIGDERLLYKATVKNEASDKPKVGDELVCNHSTPGGTPTPTVTYKWLRDGEEIAGESAKTYIAALADAGNSIQCVITGTNDPDGEAGAFAPISLSRVSLPPLVVEPQPTVAAPSGSSEPQVGGGRAALPKGTATTTAGSNRLTDVVTTKGTGTLTAGSKTVTGFILESGIIDANRHPIDGAGIPHATGTATFIRDKAGPVSVESATGTFAVGQQISGTGTDIDGQRILAVGPGPTIDLGAPHGEGTFSFSANTVLTKADPAGTLELSAAATASGPQQLVSGTFPFGLDHTISGEGIPPGTKVLGATGFGALYAREIVISNTATASKAGVEISGTATVTCEAPGGWSGNEIEWSFQWLRNGVPIPGETGPEYTVTEADIEPPSALQCEAIAEDAEGRKAVAISGKKEAAPTPPSPYQLPNGGTPAADFANQTTGPVTLELQAPEDESIYIFKATSTVENSWKCAKTPPTPTEGAAVTCTGSDSLPPGNSYQPLDVLIALGESPPTTLVTKAEVSGGGAPLSAFAEDEYTIPNPALPFGFKAFETEVLDSEGNEYAQAGGHPLSAGASLEFNAHTRAQISGGQTESLNGATKVVRTDVPAGFVGNPEALEGLCPSITGVISENCPAASVVGSISARLGGGAGTVNGARLYAIEPEAGTPAQFAFSVAEYLFTLTPELRPQDGYGVTLATAPLSKTPEIFWVTAELCGHGTKLGSGEVTCRKPNEAGALERPFISLPTKCGDPASATTIIHAESWEGDKAQAQHTLKTPEGCEELSFEPTIKARPTTTNADSPTGLDFNLHIPQNEDPEGTATAHLKKAVVTLPEGLVVNPSGANGLGACSEAQVGMKDGVPDNEPVFCPDASKIGSVSVTTPILGHPLPGTLYVAMPHENPFDSLLALYLVVESPKDGLVIKLAGEVEANRSTGRLTTTFDQNPQAPVEDVALKLRSGASAPLRTPTTCAKYKTTASLTPWSAPQSGLPATPSDSWQVNRGPSGGACVSSPPNAPSFEAGTASAIAGAHSPFVVKLSREDGTQQFSEVTVSPPPGLLAKLAGTSQCPESALAQAQGKSGKQEQSSPSCPPSSELGNVIAAAGAGPAPYQAQGKAYLAGPYKGAPLSLAILTPAVAGPFDLGVVVVRAAAYVDPQTARITVKADPLPTILQGIPLDVRSATVAIDRPGFVLNPTSCDPMAVNGSLLSTLGQTATLENRFQLAECGRLAFKPKLGLRLKGKTRRGDYQGLKATLTAKPGEANIASASVTLPRSAFLAQEHIRTVCTRVQFAADACPKGSIYGKAKAVTPLLDEPLSGPVYLRSSNNKLPDLVVALKGPASLPIEIELAGRTDSKKGALRNTFDLVPDAPVTKFTLELFGGRKGLIVNSRNLCTGTQRASVEMSAQSGKARSLRPVVRNDCRKARKGRRGSGSRRSP